jgi:hypothetical protein
MSPEQEQLFKNAELPNKQIVQTLNNHHDQLELLVSMVLELQGKVVNLEGKQ